MKWSYGLILGLALSASLALAAEESIEQSLTVNASPLQAYQAMCVDWQMIQWNGGMAAITEVRPGGFWRVTYPDNHIEEGLFTLAEPMRQLTYSHYIDETPTTVNVMFVGSGSGTEIHIKHSEFGDGRDGSDRQTRAAQMWSERLPVLADYLNTRPGSYAARPRGAGPFPAVLLLHDAFGLNRSMRVLADSIARAGYYTLAVDMFRGDVTGDVTEAQRFAAIVNSEDAITAAVRGFDALQKNPHVIAGQGSVFGLGFGADVALAVAAANSKVSACVAWYGDGLRDESLYRRISCPVLTVFGDPNVDQPRAELAGQNQSLVQAGVRAETMVVQAAPRFADTGYGADYNASAATQAWRRSLGFLDTQRRR